MGEGKKLNKRKKDIKGAPMIETWPSLLVMFFFLPNSMVPMPCLGFNSSWSFKPKIVPKSSTSLGELQQTKT
jgi:hypothetical protein